jgi:hypothetical protein
MKVDTFTDAELEALLAVAHKDWLAGFDAKLMPGRIQTMKAAEQMRKVMGMAALVLQHDRAVLTFAVREMRKTPASVQREQTIISALDTGLHVLEGQAALLREARERLRTADARLKLAELEE